MKRGIRGTTKAGNFFVRHELVFELLFVLLCGAFYFVWALAKYENYAPDEIMRLMIPRFIYTHGYLPTGWESEVTEFQWGISYAFKPTQLPAILSALFMKLMSFFRTSSY